MDGYTVDSRSSLVPAELTYEYFILREGTRRATPLAAPMTQYPMIDNGPRLSEFGLWLFCLYTSC